MTIRWTPTAFSDLQSVHTYIAADNRAATATMVDQLLQAITALAKHPQMGRIGRVAGTRELVVRPYVIVYRGKGVVLELLAIIHGARKWPESF